MAFSLDFPDRLSTTANDDLDQLQPAQEKKSVTGAGVDYIGGHESVWSGLLRDGFLGFVYSESMNAEYIIFMLSLSLNKLLPYIEIAPESNLSCS